jgi:hypothetical protein
MDCHGAAGPFMELFLGVCGWSVELEDFLGRNKIYGSCQTWGIYSKKGKRKKTGIFVENAIPFRRQNHANMEIGKRKSSRRRNAII